MTLQSVLRESRELHGDLEAMHEKVEILSETLQVEAMGQQVSELSRHTEELEQSIRSRLQSLQDAAKVYFFFMYYSVNYTILTSFLPMKIALDADMAIKNNQLTNKLVTTLKTFYLAQRDCVCILFQDMERFESEVKDLHVLLEQVQVTLTSPELARLSLKEQLTQRQVHLSVLILKKHLFSSLRHPLKIEATSYI